MTKRTPNGYYNTTSHDLGELTTVCAQTLDLQSVPLAAAINKNVPVYDMPALDANLRDHNLRQSLMSEWAWNLRHGSGVIALKSAITDHAIIDRASDAFRDIVKSEAAGGTKGDHFAAAGKNDRIWNVLQKHCEHDPENFVAYYSNLALVAASEAWLGPDFQMTAQMNLVRPGGGSQSMHRDYHLGFQSQSRAMTYPRHVHELSPLMTLQGAVAHCDMPINSGPTKLLPFSQSYDAGYIGFHEATHSDFFEENYIQLELNKGDMLFFNPALFHAAGANTSADIHRMANLLQVSSAFGRPMEMINRTGMCLLAYPYLGAMSPELAFAAIASIAEGYAFPTNLDTDPPIGGNAPASQADIMREAVRHGWSLLQLRSALDDNQHRRKT